MNKLDLERLKVDREYWDSVAPKGAEALIDSNKWVKWDDQDELFMWDDTRGKGWDVSKTPFSKNDYESRYMFITTRPEPATEKSSEWESQGLPPVGTVCEIQLTSGNWVQCKILFTGKESIIFEDYLGNERVEYAKPELFRPIRTEEDKAVDEMTRALEKAECDMPDGCDMTYNRWLALCMIKAGYRKQEK
jgi:hypothetical protein